MVSSLHLTANYSENTGYMVDLLCIIHIPHLLQSYLTASISIHGSELPRRSIITDLEDKKKKKKKDWSRIACYHPCG